jgi:hypothetical protein
MLVRIGRLQTVLATNDGRSSGDNLMLFDHQLRRRLRGRLTSRTLLRFCSSARRSFSARSIVFFIGIVIFVFFLIVDTGEFFFLSGRFLSSDFVLFFFQVAGRSFGEFLTEIIADCPSTGSSFFVAATVAQRAIIIVVVFDKVAALGQFAFGFFVEIVNSL